MILIFTFSMRENTSTMLNTHKVDTLNSSSRMSNKNLVLGAFYIFLKWKLFAS
jgi:hypothetical protein